ncbi:hypothetical protein [Streptacidiphilus rugosus]|uniref:hypothetical protein n=1 Tax=Streptacidiphilus rugosus TaxID=405783 RepID=UPI00068D0BBA|nr:hypothetical protein [Streptacidiphilus rugosus]
MTHDDEAQQIREALWATYDMDNGALRNARAEDVVARAERTGDVDLLLDCLRGLMSAYEFSAERSKMFVPFTRALQLWDADPSQFDKQQAHSLFWWFKWVTSSMLDYPEIPLAAIEQWLVEMERRYRLAGHAARTVRWVEFYVAWHLGDEDRAAGAYAQVLAADRDSMSDCHACEAGSMGLWESERGDDKGALERWAPVLSGGLSCAEEPHRVLAKTLLPLVRLDRLDEARANHLRGYRLARGNESLIATVGKHIEFCALTGNEARGLEILADHVQHLDQHANPDARLSLLEAAALLLGRLDALGLGEQPTAGPAGRTWTVAELLAHVEAERSAIAARFDARNGSDATSRRSRERVAQPPLLDRLPLGAAARRLPRVPDAAAPTKAAAATAAGADESFEDLLTRARTLRDQGHPAGRPAWLAVEGALAARGGTDDLRLRAELAAQRGIRVAGEDPEAALAAFTEAAELSAEADLMGDAAVQTGRAALALALLHRPDEARETASRAVAMAQAAGADTRRRAGVQLSRAKVLGLLAGHENDDAGRAAARSAAEEVLAQVGAAAAEAEAEPRLHAIGADARHLLAGLGAGDAVFRAALLREAADAYDDAGQPWHAAAPLGALARQLARAGELGPARATALTALERGEILDDAEETGLLHLLVADLAGHQEDHEEAVRHALDAARWLDEAGLAEGPGAAARFRLAKAYQGLDRHAEAAEVLQSALPDLLAQGEGQGVSARRALADSLATLGEHAARAEQLLEAMAVTSGWTDDRGSHAHLAWATAEALADAGRVADAVAAYAEATRLWRELDAPVPVIRTLRARGWLLARGEEPDLDAARAAFAEAEAAAVEGLAVPGEEEWRAAFREELRGEAADTARQLANLLRQYGAEAETREECLGLFERAAAGFGELGPDFDRGRATALLGAAEICAHAGESARARELLGEVLGLAESHGDALRQEARRARRLSDWLDREAE